MDGTKAFSSEVDIGSRQENASNEGPGKGPGTSALIQSAPTFAKKPPGDAKSTRMGGWQAR
jgi:hypothetical protein